MSVVCPAGHTSTSDDYCDVCGMPVGGPPVPDDPAPTPADPTATQDCPNCAAQAPAAALFCESCGYDFTTGALPDPPTPLDLSTGMLPTVNPPSSPVPQAAPDLDAPPVPSAPPTATPWVAEVWVDPDWYHHLPVAPDDPLPSVGLPQVVALRVRTALVGRPSRSRGINPEVDCTPDSSVSRRHAQLTTDGQRWWVEDLQSANGTFVAAAGEPFPDDPITPGQRRELADGDRVFVGGWTRLVLREALPGEV
ncbi:MAG: FHA domain-containing protein [Micrococcales bacterium]|nr:FHA domain-containing protein [Micrococcales bacterium]